MENIKEKIIIGICLVIFMIMCIFVYQYTFIKSKTYYTQVDNTKVEKLSENKYEYNLKGFDKDGESKELKFDTTRELKSDAYLKIDCMLFRGVISWSEVQFDEIPTKAQKKIE